MINYPLPNILKIYIIFKINNNNKYYYYLIFLKYLQYVYLLMIMNHYFL